MRSTLHSFITASAAIAVVKGCPTKSAAGSSDLLPSYDYVVVGAGASGLTVANRLSENPDISVLVLEAGEFDAGEDFVKIPGLAGGAIGTKYDWNLTYSGSGTTGSLIAIPLGKVVGGSTKLNRMVFDRGSKSDYDRWATLGNTEWNWNSLFPYFKKNEKFTPPGQAIAAEYNITFDASAHGTDGLMDVTYSPFFWPTTKKFIGAIKELGISIPTDQASGNAIGGYFCPHNQNPQTVVRSSAREAYYDWFTTRPNLRLVTGQQVTRLLTTNSGNGTSITGVEFAAGSGSARSNVRVNREVILAAGSIHTPQILQLSGIGNPSLLSRFNITTVVDLPAVGQSFQDHISVAVVDVISAPVVASNLTNNATFAAEARALYDSQKTGPFSSPTGDFLTFLPLSTFSNKSTDLQTQATAQNIAANLAPDTPAEVLAGYKSQHDVLTERLTATDSALLEIIWADGVYVLANQHPYSRGSVKIASADPFTAPIADPGYLTNPLDVQILAEGIKFVRSIAGTNAFSPLQPFNVVPGANVTSAEALESFIRSSAGTMFHPAGSCKIGKKEEGGVVDQELKVYGVSGLRIVDASIMPLLPAAHTMTTVYAVAEKAADIIRQQL